MRKKHASWEEILALLESADSADSTVRSHLTQCERCAHLVAEARTMLGLLAGARLPVPPSPLVERTLALLHEAAGQAEAPGAREAASGPHEVLARLKSASREIWATLVADSLRPAADLRGSSVTSPRLVRYETADYIVTLSLAPAPPGDARDVMGQLVPRRGVSLPAGACAAAPRGEQKIEADIGPTGEFRLEQVPAASPQVDILVGQDWIHLRLPG